ncbi:MAG: tRNA 2-thiouridine(34) synthase MnmA [Bacteroidales bacterium]|nr:tRNA 2-thiouridine(34) synthase MnmA [Bacteroidales bacterium]
MQKVVIGLSGGVDSSVAAYLLKQQGYDVIAVYMINWKDTVGTLSGACPYEEDVLVAELVARKLDIPFHVVDLSDTYRAQVVDYMFSEYEKGRTPNPDVLCNREIKFDAFLKAASDLGAEKIATGHYCRCDAVQNEQGDTMYRLLAGTDDNKDQSYFLCQLSQAQLSKALFPVGDMLKPEIRRIATELGLATAQKKDSQGICFVGKVDLPVFLQQKLAAREGQIYEIPFDFKAYQRKYPEELHLRLQKSSKPYFYRPKDGKLLSTKHNGAHFYTVGQRKGLHIGGTEKPMYVLATDIENNYIFVGRGDDHPGLLRSALFIAADEVHWIRPDKALKVGECCEYQVRIRYRQPLQKAVLHCFEEGLYIAFEEHQKSVTAGQFAAWYDGDELVGSGVISE